MDSARSVHRQRTSSSNIVGLYVKDRAKHRIFDTYGFVCLGPSDTSTYGFVCLGPSETSDFWIHQTEDFWIHELVATCPVSSQVREILESRDLFCYGDALVSVSS